MSSTVEPQVNVDNNTGIIDQMIDKKVFLFEPWFMGIAVAILLSTIIVTLLYTLLCQRRGRRYSREAILNSSQDQIIREPKTSYTKPCAIVGICLSLIAIIMAISFFAHYMRSTGQSFEDVYSSAWVLVSKLAVEPWFISILFGILLIVAVLFSVCSILKETKKASTTTPHKTRANRRTNNKKGVCSQPWFIAFLCALVLIVILSAALFYLVCQKQGENIMESVSRFFFFEPWFFGIVVGVVLATLIVFNIYRILRGKGENYSVNDEQMNQQEIVIESQGFDEYPSKPNTDIQSSGSPNHEPTKSPTKSITTVPMPQQQQQTIASTTESKAPAAAMPASLSLHLTEGHFYDEKQFHDEDDSMAEYGLGENDQFNDEGSFIGLYNRDRIQNYMAQFNKNNLNN